MKIFYGLLGWVFFIIPISIYSQTFIEQIDTVLTGVCYSSQSWGDYDNDGDLDILITGASAFNGHGFPNAMISKIVENLGDNTFTETAIELPGVCYSSISWGDYNNDGYLDFILTGASEVDEYGVPTTIVSKIFKNNEGKNFTDIEVDLIGVCHSSVAWGDYDNDGDLDFLLSGASEFEDDGIPTAVVSKIYRNDGSDQFTETSISLTGVAYSAVAWGDFDNDDFLDIIITGNFGANYYSSIYNNNKNNTFSKVTDLTGVFRGSVSLADYDYDGDLDILLTGAQSKTTPFNPISAVYRNNGDNTFTNIAASLTKVFNSAAGWGDCDNDGDLDILLSGYYEDHGDHYYTAVYSNGDGNTFTLYEGITGVAFGSVCWGDCENDGDLDILLSGYDGANNISSIYQNTSHSDPNILPVAPINTSAVVNNTLVRLYWEEVTGDETRAEGLTYNLRIGSNINTKDNILSPHAADNGFRRIAALANLQHGLRCDINIYESGKYFWSVQAIDNNFAGGNFSIQDSFVVANWQATGLAVSSIKSSSASLSWARGTGDKCAVFLKENGSGSATAKNYTTYVAKDSMYLGSNDGNGWYCVYNGTSTAVSVKNLKVGTVYVVQIFEYLGSLGDEHYNHLLESSNNKTFTTMSNYFELTSVTLDPVYVSCLDWGDYDSDGDLDLLLTGATLPWASYYGYVSKVYRNNGNFSFTNIGLSITPAMGFAAAQWFDFDNDNDLDIVIIGNTGRVAGDYTYKTYCNNGNGTFSGQPSIVLEGLASASLIWGDYDYDGDLDIVYSGINNSSAPISKLLKNNGDITFSNQFGIPIKGTSGGNLEFRDFNNDGLLDIFLAGGIQSTEAVSIFSIYMNNGNNTFTEHAISGSKAGTIKWGDYDNDGDYDYLVTGADSGYHATPFKLYAKIYKNQGNFNFVDQTDISIEGISGSCDWGDYDNDGNLDILMSGRTTSQVLAKIYRNNGVGSNYSFTLAPESIIGAYNGTANFVDADSDGDLDLVITGDATISGDGYANSGSFKLYRNEAFVKNRCPEAPTGIDYSIDGANLNVTWARATDDITPSKLLTYNMRFDTVAGDNQLFTSQARSDGTRLVLNSGNRVNDTTFQAPLLPDTYYFAVQAIDQSFKGSAFAVQQIVVDSVQATNLTGKIVPNQNLLLKWKRGNGSRCAVFMKIATADTAYPEINTKYVGSTEFGKGDKIGTTDWYCVYNGVSDSVVVSGLETYNNYMAHAIEYLEKGDSIIYFKEKGTNIRMVVVSAFTQQSSIILPGVYASSASWADYDNNGDLDILISGAIGTSGTINSITNIYKNNRNNTFSEQAGIIFTDVCNSSVTWGDYNNNGYLDVVIAGDSMYTSDWSYIYRPKSNIYKNNSNNTFSRTTIPLVFQDNGSATWGDLDNDSDLDIIITGSINAYSKYLGSYPSSPITKIYNNNNGSFSTIVNSISPVYMSSVALGDYDNDGDLDILLTGAASYNSISKKPMDAISKIYRNEGSWVFAEQSSISLTGVYYSSVAWGDYNNDGYLDILLTGTSDGLVTGAVSKIYRNNGNGTFSEQTTILLPGVYYSSVQWNDYNNDGYLDIFLMGSTDLSTGSAISRIYLNNGNNTFTQQTGTSLADVYSGSAASADYDNDGDLDILLTGFNTISGPFSKVYQNNTIMSSGVIPINVKPAFPITLPSEKIQGGVKLKWNAATDDITPESSLSYNVVVDTLKTALLSWPKNTDTLRIVAFGNAGLNHFYNAKYPAGKYYYRVQAIDGGLKGGELSTIDSFDIKNVAALFFADTVCHGLATNFTNQSSATAGFTSTWYFGDGQSSTELSPIHIYENAGNYEVKLVVTENSENAKDSLSLNIVVKPKPIVNFIANPACNGASSSFVNGTVFPAGISEGTWNWNFGSSYVATPTQTVKDPIPVLYATTGTYTVKLKATANNGCADSLTNNAIVEPNPDASISVSGNLTYCEGSNVVLSASAPSQANCNYNWLKAGNVLTGEIKTDLAVTTSGTYKLRVTNSIATCIAETNEPKTVIVNAIPVIPAISANGATTFCSGGSVMLSILPQSGVTYQWKNDNVSLSASNSNQYTASLNGNYTVSITNANGCSVASSDTIKVTVNALPTISTISNTGSTSFCKGDSVLLTVSPQSGVTYQWKNNGGNTGANSNQFYAKLAGAYSINITNTYGCMVSSPNSVLVTVNQLPSVPVINYTGSTAFCSGDSILFTTIAEAGITYQWKMDGGFVGNGLSLNAKQTGNYNITALNSLTGCITNSINYVSVTTKPKPEIPSLSFGNTTLCKGESVTISTDNINGLNYQWKNGYDNIIDATSNQYKVITQGAYWLQVKNSYNCTANTLPIKVTVNEVPVIPIIEFNTPLEFCQDDSVVLTIEAMSGISRQWFKDEIPVMGASGTELIVKNSGNYSLKLSNASGCTIFSNSLVVTVNPKPAIPSISRGETSFCSGKNLLLAVNNTPDILYQWMNSDRIIADSTANQIYVNSSGNYYLEVENLKGCKVKTESIAVTVWDSPGKPVIGYVGDTSFCPGGSLLLETENNPDFTYQWKLNGGSIGINSSSFAAQYEGKYNLVVTNANNCQAFSSNSIEVKHFDVPLSPVIMEHGNTSFCKGDSVLLSLNEVQGCTPKWLRFDASVLNNSLNYYAKSEGDYKAVLTNSFGCTSSPSNTITVSTIESPNAVAISFESSNLCEGETAQLSVDPQSNCTYQWYSNGNEIIGEINSDLKVDKTGLYHIKISNNKECNYIAKAVDIRVSEVPLMQTIKAEGETTICPGENVELSLVNNNKYNYQWLFDGVEILEGNTNLFTAKEEGKYSAIIANKENANCYITTPTAELIFKPALPKPKIVAEGPNVWILACDNTTAKVYKWYYQGDLVQGATEYIYVANQKLGDYYVTINDGGDCHVASDIITIPLNTTGITEAETVFGNIKIYPNPTPGLFTIEMDNQIIGTLYIRIINEIAKELFNIKHTKTTKYFQTHMDLSGQGDGVYFVEFRFGDERVVKKVVVE